MSFNRLEVDPKPALPRGATRLPTVRVLAPVRPVGGAASRVGTESDRAVEHAAAGHHFGRMRIYAQERRAEVFAPNRSHGYGPDPVTAPVPHAVVDEGSTGTASMESGSIGFEKESVNLHPGLVNEWGELDGELSSDVSPRVFTNGGKTGSAAVHWGGGGGGKGNQGVGSITLTAPGYESRDPPAAGGSAQAWIRTGTGRATATRSYTSVLTGANGANWYITANASARIDRHEETHVASTRSIHGARIEPLERRIAQREGEPNALSHGSTRAEAITALKNFIDWNATITNFRNDDTTANQPGGTTDTTDSGTADFYQNYGPRTVGGVNYPNYVDTPPGPGP